MPQERWMCPVCGSRDVVDVTSSEDSSPVGLCSNGHTAPLRLATGGQAPRRPGRPDVGRFDVPR
jgi:hypothetical protein